MSAWLRQKIWSLVDKVATLECPPGKDNAFGYVNDPCRIRETHLECAIHCLTEIARHSHTIALQSRSCARFLAGSLKTLTISCLLRAHCRLAVSRQSREPSCFLSFSPPQSHLKSTLSSRIEKEPSQLLENQRNRDVNK